jgi:methylmalonyl-CoA mutase
LPREVIRATAVEKAAQIEATVALRARWPVESAAALARLQRAAASDKNLFAELLEATKVCTLGQITQALYAVGGQYRRNM